MDKIKYIPLALFVLFATKCLILGVGSYESAAVLLILGLAASYYEFKSQDRVISGFKTELEAARNDQKKLERDMDSLRNHVSSLKLTGQFRSQKAM